MLLFVFFIYKISFIKKYKTKTVLIPSISLLLRLTIIAVSFIEEVVLVTKILLERQFVMLKFDRMTTKTKIANLNQLGI